MKIVKLCRTIQIHNEALGMQNRSHDRVRIKKNRSNDYFNKFWHSVKATHRMSNSVGEDDGKKQGPKQYVSKFWYYVR